MFKGSGDHVNQNACVKLTSANGLLQRMAERALWLLAPARCLLCDHKGDVGSVDICHHCLNALPRGTAGWQPGIGAIARVLGPWRYQFPVDALIKSLKFGSDRAAARLLGSLLAKERLTAGGPLPHCVVPVPLHARRLRDRGFNQANEIAQFAARPLGLRVAAGALRRQKATVAQSGLSLSGRLANPHGAFVATGALTGTRIALVDDVITTGSTAVAAAEALLAAGAAEVELWVLARVARRTDILHTG